jgi:monoamine oxidase
VTSPVTRRDFGGAYVQWSDDAAAARDALAVLARSDGPFYFAGEHVSHVPGRIEGAVRSAQASVAQIARRSKTATPASAPGR